MPESFQVIPVGVIRKKEDAIWIEIFEPYCGALLGLEGFSHIQRQKNSPDRGICHPLSPAAQSDRVDPMQNKMDPGPAYRDRRHRRL